ncbi:Peptidase M43, pregnancy-associated plasma-A [Ophiocordyceps camponoti-floridani]|uniref:Peptidase M43, pregnancy-associated plasma-A n=1 Tax=Ophiocordyceps camponoti-floridani TaxID=2030778 RepID=A0A8H4VBD5_9HYPO|nr:Peptidase M43, pregnancy-associated plasma-A [Ophiocordyceps camponoti-floridani]
MINTKVKACLASLFLLVLGLELDCKKLKCYEDAVHVAGSEEQLPLQCLHGLFRDSLSRKGPCLERGCPAAKCNAEEGLQADQVSVHASQYKPICSCVRYKAIPAHCYNVGCYRELVALSGESGGRLRDICNWHLASRADLRVPVEMLSKHVQGPVCRLSKMSGQVALVDEAHYRAACECGVGSEWRRRPEYGDDAPWNHEPIYIDVFIHFIARNPGDMFPWNQPAVVEDFFNYSVNMPLSTHVRFTIKVVQIIVHHDWALGGNSTEMRRRLHIGDSRDLNLYIIEKIDGSDGRDTRPLDPDRQVYCTPPYGFSRWSVEDVGPPHQDGCILSLGFRFGSADVFPYIYQEMQRWFGFCTKNGRECAKTTTPQEAPALHNTIAQTRFIPQPRAILTVKNSQVKSPCEKHKCFREMEFLFGSIEVLTAHCRHNELTRWEGRDQVKDFMIREPSHGFPGSTCGRNEASLWVVPASDWEPLCDCIRESGMASRWAFTNETLNGVSEDRPIHVDVFIHVIASSRESLMAKRYFRIDRDLEDEFDQIKSFYKSTRIELRLRYLDLRVNERWADGHDSAHMRETLYTGGSRDLNLYYIEAEQLENVVLTKEPLKVYCSFPYSSWWAYLAYSEPEHDGCIVAAGAWPSVTATALQHWMGVMNARDRSCGDPECGPEFGDEDKENMYRLLALNRFVPIEKKRPLMERPTAEGLI